MTPLTTPLAALAEALPDVQHALDMSGEWPEVAWGAYLTQLAATNREEDHALACAVARATASTHATPRPRGDASQGTDNSAYRSAQASDGHEDSDDEDGMPPFEPGDGADDENPSAEVPRTGAEVLAAALATFQNYPVADIDPTNAAPADGNRQDGVDPITQNMQEDFAQVLEHEQTMGRYMLDARTRLLYEEVRRAFQVYDNATIWSPENGQFFVEHHN